MNTHLYISLFLVTLLCYSCNKQKQDNGIEADFSQMEEIEIDVKNGAFISYDDCVEKIDFIKLETTDNNLIGKISQILFADSLIIVADSESSKAVYIYNMQGRLKYKISAVGNGPAEYVDISNVMLVPAKKQLAILDRVQHKVIYFDMTGKYLSYERIPFMLIYFEYDESGNKIVEIRTLKDPSYGKYMENTIMITDEKNNITGGAFKYTYSEQFQFSAVRPLRKYGQTVYYSPDFSNIIYTVNNTSIMAKYHIDIKENGMHAPLPDDITDKRFKEYCEKYLFFNGDFVELKDYTYLNIATPWGNPSVIYSHEKQITFLCSGNGSHPFHNFLTDSPKAAFGNNCIVIDVQPYFIIAYKEQFYKEKKYKALLDSLYEELDEDDNPVLFFYHLKIN